jgi:hypothetical protein
MPSRREFVAGLGAAAAGSVFTSRSTSPIGAIGTPPATPFTLSILTDEISQDFAHACEVAARDFGLYYGRAARDAQQERQEATRTDTVVDSLSRRAAARGESSVESPARQPR